MKLNNSNQIPDINLLNGLGDDTSKIGNDTQSQAELISSSNEKKPLSTKKIAWISIAFFVLALSAVIAYQIFRGNWFKVMNEVPKKVDKEHGLSNGVNFYDLPEFIVDLTDAQDGSNYIRLELTLEVNGRDNMQRVKQLEPKIQDILNIYLRELRLSDIKGTYGLYRLREELFIRINAVLAPARIENVLFKVIRTQ